MYDVLVTMQNCSKLPAVKRQFLPWMNHLQLYGRFLAPVCQLCFCYFIEKSGRRYVAACPACSLASRSTRQSEKKELEFLFVFSGVKMTNVSFSSGDHRKPFSPETITLSRRYQPRWRTSLFRSLTLFQKWKPVFREGYDVFERSPWSP